MNKPRFSIIIPLFNREILVRDTIDSLLNQTDSDWEAILVDDGSTDRSREVVREYAQQDTRIRLFERAPDRTKGPSACRNIGFENARGQLVYYLDSDDLLEKHFCENAGRAFLEDPSLDFLGVQCVYFSGSVRDLVQKEYPVPTHDDCIRSYYLEKTLWVQSESFCWKKSFLERFPRHWPEDQRVGEDRVCYYRILTHPCKGAWGKGTVQVYHRTGKTADGKNDQLTPQINRDPELARQRVLTAERLIDAFRAADSLNQRTESLLLDNALCALRGVLSYNHRAASKECFRLLTEFARERKRPDFVRKAKRYMRLKALFRFHRIPMVEQSYGFLRRLRKGARR